ncbi:MAG: methyltransferase, partial [Cyanobacteria bacterium 13_1_40CM_2_61_4]
MQLVLSLGSLPLANALVTAEQLDQQESTYPLELAFCPKCSLVQITETVPPEELFRDYLYFSSFSDTMLSHAQAIVERVIEWRPLDANSLAVEIASNDGYLLQYYKQAGIPVLGIEPAINIARVAQDERGIRTLTDFFDAETAARLVEQGERADVIHANNVLAHVPDLNGFVRGLRLLLKPEGVAIIEVPYVKDLIDRCEFDTIYHEHLSYFSFTAVNQLFERQGLAIQWVERLAIHGGSLRIFVGVDSGAQRPTVVTELLDEETRWGVNQVDFYQDFAQRVAELKTSLRNFVFDLKDRKLRLAAYGAAAKGSTLLNYLGIGRSALDFVVDRSTHKQGRYMPGVRLPIYSPARLLEE